MTVIKKRNQLLAIIFVIASFTGAYSQTYYNDAAGKYNEGIGLMKTDVVSAIGTFESCIQICDQVGDSAVSLREKATGVLADLYFQKAYKIYSVDKLPFEALQATKQALAVAQKYNIEKTKEKSNKFLVQLYGITGSSYFKDKAYDKAIVAFDSALIINPEYISAIFNKSLVYKAQENADMFGKTIDIFIEKVTKLNDTVQLAKAQKLALDFYRIAGNKANQNNKLADAITLLNSSLKYGTDEDVFYALSNVLNKQKKFDDALSYAEKGLALEAGAPEAKAKFYYEIAVAQVGKGMNTEACQSFTNAKYGQFVEASKAQMTNLKCKP